MQERHHPLLNQTLGTNREIVSYHFGPTTSGRKVYIQSSLHADELPGMLVSWFLKKKLCALESQGVLASEVVLVPVCNPMGLDQHVQAGHLGRFELDSGENFNRNYPDMAALIKDRLPEVLSADVAANKRLIRQRMAEALAELQAETQLQAQRIALMKLACDADLMIDLHCDWEAVLHLYTADPLWADVEPLARYLGAQTSLLATESGGNPFDEACSQTWYRLADEFAGQFPIPRNGCVAITVELRGQGEVGYVQAEADADAILDYLAHQAYINRSAPALPSLPYPATPLAGVEPVKTMVSGIVVHRCEPGAILRAGDPVADIVNPLTDTVTTLTTVRGGRLFARHVQRFATAGDTIARVAGNEAFRTGNLLTA